MTKEELIITCNSLLDKIKFEAKAMDAARSWSYTAFHFHKDLHDKYYAEFNRLMDEYLKG